MKLKELDINFRTDGALDGNIDYYDVAQPPFEIYGVYFDKELGFMRMPERVAKSCKSEGMLALLHCSAGGRIKFSTNSARLEICVKYKAFDDMTHMPRSGQAGFTLVEETGGKQSFLRNFRPDFTNEVSQTGEKEVVLVSSNLLKSKGEMRSYCLYMPLYSGVKSLVLGFDQGSKVDKGRPYKPNKSVLYYGSSITQGGCAGRSDNSYQSFISKWTNTDYINLGFSGNAKGEIQMAEHLASHDCNVFVCDYDYNATSAEELRNKHYIFYKTYRNIRPNTPILFISKPDVDYGTEIKERVEIIKRTVQKAKKSGDKNVYFLCGQKLLGKNEESRHMCTVDGVHPNDLGFYRMAKAIRKALAKIDRAYK